jgi:DNA-directed RNA polymerase II subunit RPB1
MSMKTYSYSEDVLPIDRIEFCIFGNKEVRNYSVVGRKGGKYSKENDPLAIVHPETYDNNQPKRSGLIDPRLGTVDNNRECETCGLMAEQCPGHFGHTDFVQPVFNYGFRDEIKAVLGCVCLNCSKLLVNKSDEELEKIMKYKTGKKRMEEVKKLTASVNVCQRPGHGCGTPVSKIKMEVKNNAIIQYVKETFSTEEEGAAGVEGAGGKRLVREVLLPSRVYAIFKLISDDDCRLMGLDPAKSRPEDMIIEKFPIPPVHIRPSVKTDLLASSSAEDTLNNKLADIIKANNMLAKYKDTNNINEVEQQKLKSELLACLQYNVAAYFDNDSNLPKTEVKTCGRPVKSITERLKAKGGRIRNNLMGKRVNFCARSVITSDPNLSLDELGVPIKIAMNNTIPEVVTAHNYDLMTRLVRNGRDTYPGANLVFVKNKQGSDSYDIINLKYQKATVKLNYGDIVERHIMDGDPVLFNRQPTLHKMSMMCHKVKVINDERLSTFRINVSCTTPYNADRLC